MLILDLEDRLRRLEKEEARLRSEVNANQHHEDILNDLKIHIEGVLAEKQSLRLQLDQLNKD